MYPAFRTIWQPQKPFVCVRRAHFNGQSLAQAMFREIVALRRQVSSQFVQAGAVDPNHVDDILLQPDGGLQFRGREQEADCDGNAL
jgi:hypothetical protein